MSESTLNCIYNYLSTTMKNLFLFFVIFFSFANSAAAEDAQVPFYQKPYPAQSPNLIKDDFRLRIEEYQTRINGVKTYIRPSKNDNVIIIETKYCYNPKTGTTNKNLFQAYLITNDKVEKGCWEKSGDLIMLYWYIPGNGLNLSVEKVSDFVQPK